MSKSPLLDTSSSKLSSKMSEYLFLKIFAISFNTQFTLVLSVAGVDRSRKQC